MNIIYTRKVRWIYRYLKTCCWNPIAVCILKSNANVMYLCKLYYLQIDPCVCLCSLLCHYAFSMKFVRQISFSAFYHSCVNFTGFLERFLLHKFSFNTILQYCHQTLFSLYVCLCVWGGGWFFLTREWVLHASTCIPSSNIQQRS